MPKVKGPPPIRVKTCIRFWESLLKETGCLMGVTTVTFIEATIRHLKGLEVGKSLPEKVSPKAP